MRTDSLTRIGALVLAGLAMITTGLLAGVADGKKQGQGGGKVTVLSTQQHAILDADAVTVEVKGGSPKKSVLVEGLQSGGGTVPLTGSAAVDPGKSVIDVPLSSAGRAALSGCAIEALRGRLLKANKEDEGGSGSATALDRDLAVCSVGSENPTPRPYHGPPIDTSNADRCDFMDPALCLQPWPNDYFTRPDATTDTGRRLNLNVNSTPANKNGAHLDPTDINRADGFSPGNLISIKIPRVETQAAFDNTGFVPISDLHRYADANQPVVVIDAATGQRQPIWAELDANPNHYTPGNTQDVNLIIRPAKNFDEGHRYIVALRGLRDAQDNPVDPPMPFRVYRDRLMTSNLAIENRRPHMENLISTLQGDGIQRSNLYMAWDFTVASEHSLAGRALAIRDDALHQLGDDTPGDGVIDGGAPTFHITSVQDAPDSDVPANTLRLIDGELTNIPCYLSNGNCHPGGTFNYAPGSPDPVATATGIADDPHAVTTGVRFQCVIPNSALAGGTMVNPTQSGIFGHGLLGDFTQVDDMVRFSNSEANISNTTWCATNWAGFSIDDIGTVISVLSNVSNFPKLSDRMVQGFVNMIYLGRAMLHPDGFDTDPAFQLDPDGGGGEDPIPVLDPAQGLYWEGISQGAIMGGALTALEPDLTQSVLNVVGMNYSTLLRRSTDSAQYFELPGLGLYANYPNQLERPLLLSLMQLLWDRGEANGYAHHMTGDPLPNTPPHRVLLQLAYGDHQVTNVAAEVEARTIGAQVHTPALDPGRHWDINPFLGIPAISSYPFSGSAALVYYDGGPLGFDGDQDCTDENGNPQHGTAPAPLVELPPKPVSVYGCDPHGYPRRALDGVTHEATWLQPNGFIDQCADPAPAARPCYANGYTGP
jgi:hypothetical protein